MIKTLEDLDLSHKKVILRCDLNVPLIDGVITDDGRIRASLSTIQKLQAQNCSIVIIAHLGRPKGKTISGLSMRPVAKRMGELLNQEIIFTETILGNEEVALKLKPGEIMMLENIRFEEAETSKNETDRIKFATKLSAYGQIYIGDGFGAVHRKHASVYELAQLLPHGAGDLIATEVAVLENLMSKPTPPFGVILGGSKVSDKIGVISKLLDKVDFIAIGGGMAFTFLAAQGKQIGTSLFEEESVPLVQDLLARAETLGVQLILPVDVVIAKDFSNTSQSFLVSVDEIPSDQMGLDIGPISAEIFARQISGCKTAFWNGPMGVFEFDKFQNGTKVVAQALASMSGMAVVGGGDSAAAIRKLGFKSEDFAHISTGGGASLEYLEGRQLPGLIALS